ncbi:hypothetical protein LSH36_781g01051 [Paralvinella palmiformis]|uniref:Uncharacterized protein n=1 Tax=Paralvinella palmiformis TaxID=53620 RepID=A0AAD9J0N6_9ANNE|nr:hypothetical protein LSH36_781g01051 [Paralvinella palmiformis]
MSSLRSSVRPASSKQPWGTILRPEFGMGHQKMTAYEVDQTVTRLYYVPEQRETIYERQKQKPMKKQDVEEMLKRLTEGAAQKAADAKRTQKDSIYKDMGVLNAYVWRGYN